MHTKKSVREKFERLQQISDLLNIEEVLQAFQISIIPVINGTVKISDIKDLKKEWDSVGTCQLSQTEMKKILDQRVEFKNKSAQLYRYFQWL